MAHSDEINSVTNFLILLSISFASPRVIRLEKKPLDSLGLEVSGGYRVGIYVIELQENSVCRAAGLQVGDRLFKVRHTYYSVSFCRQTESQVIESLKI